MKTLTNEIMRECLSSVVEARAGADEMARVLSHAQKGDALCLVAIADALDIEPDELFAEFVAEVYLLTGQHIRPVGYAEGRQLQ